MSLHHESPFRVDPEGVESAGREPGERQSLWGAETHAALGLGPISGRSFPKEVVHHAAMIKAEVARWAGASRRVPLDRSLARAIADAADEVASGIHDAQFPIDALQTGSATATHMNINEVIARLATERAGVVVHPNDHVNFGQSSNDVMPSAVRLAAAQGLRDGVLPALALLAASLRAAARRFRGIPTVGRTHLMDAVPVDVGARFAAAAARVDHAEGRLSARSAELCVLPLGGSAVGTGLNVPPGMAAAVIRRLADRTGLPLTEARDHMAEQSGPDAFVATSGSVRAASLVLAQIAEDLRSAAAGPVGGPAEYELPRIAAGSSIMPGKINPVVPEIVLQAAAWIAGNDASVGAAALVGGRFELFTALPVLAVNLLDGLGLLGSVSVVLARRCVDGLVVDADQCGVHAAGSPAVATVLSPIIGYEATAELVRHAVASGCSIHDAVMDSGIVPGVISPEEVDRLLDTNRLAAGGR